MSFRITVLPNDMNLKIAFLKMIIGFQGSSENQDESISAPIVFEISSNASKFAAFSAIRSLVLENENKYNTVNTSESKHMLLEHRCRSRSEDGGNDCKSIDIFPPTDCKLNVPHVRVKEKSF